MSLRSFTSRRLVVPAVLAVTTIGAPLAFDLGCDDAPANRPDAHAAELPHADAPALDAAPDGGLADARVDAAPLDAAPVDARVDAPIPIDAPPDAPA